MTDRTDNRGYPYPECNPPLVKDRSDIGALRDLAEAVDADADGIDFNLQEFLERPDAARISYTGTITTTGASGGSIHRVPYDLITYDNTAGSTDLSVNALRPVEKGWYFFSSTLRCTNGADLQLSVRHLRNGRAGSVRRFEGPAALITTLESNMTCSDVLLMEAGDSVQTQLRADGVGGTFTFEGRLTMIQMYKSDI